MDKPRPGVASRAYRATFHLAAPADAVWKALTDARELARWFPPSARVEPGEGGQIELDWPGFFTWPMRVDAWEPAQRLLLTYPSGTHGPAGQEAVRLAVEFQLEGHGGETTLRIVHSGFGPDAQWDAELDGVSRGWGAELANLAHYLQRHRGHDRHIAWVWQEVPDCTRAWAQIGGQGGLASPGFATLRAGEPYAITTALGERISGRVLVSHPRGDFAGTASEWNDGTFRVWADLCGGKHSVWLYLSTWGVDPARVEAFRARWQTKLTAMLAPTRNAQGVTK